MDQRELSCSHGSDFPSGCHYKRLKEAIKPISLFLFGSWSLQIKSISIIRFHIFMKTIRINFQHPPSNRLWSFQRISPVLGYLLFCGILNPLARRLHSLYLLLLVGVVTDSDSNKLSRTFLICKCILNLSKFECSSMLTWEYTICLKATFDWTLKVIEMSYWCCVHLLGVRVQREIDFTADKS